MAMGDIHGTESLFVPFSRQYLTGLEQKYLGECLEASLIGGGKFTGLCEKLLCELVGSPFSVLTPSCTSALEMAALILDINKGDEVIMPSYTFTSTANAFVIRGATPVFVDIREDNLNINELLIEAAITKKTKAIAVVHYGGLSCEMEAILFIAKKYNLFVIEDAAQAMCSSYNSAPLGSIGDLGCFSFHGTKNISCGEGGALMVNNPDLIKRAEIARDKGTNRAAFMNNMTRFYSWIGPGSSYLTSELTASFLYAQLREAHSITDNRRSIWNKYHQFFKSKNYKGIRLPPSEAGCHGGNGHIYYIIMKNRSDRDRLIAHLSSLNITSVFHYIPLHSSPMGQLVGRQATEMQVTDMVSSRIVRLPIWVGILGHLDRIFGAIEACLG